VSAGSTTPAAAACAYFVCAEALANVAKYASASQVTVSVRADSRGIRVEVADDGTGGADPARGTGLRGLADRVETLGGTLTVDSPPGGGTRVVAVIPSGAGQA
jgi:signal transduction histidine kinase